MAILAIFFAEFKLKTRVPLLIERSEGRAGEKDENSPGYLLTFSTSIFRERTPELYLPSQSTFQRFSNPKVKPSEVSKKSKKSN